MNALDLSWLTPEVEQTQAYHRDRVRRLYAGLAPGGVIAMAGRLYGRSHGLLGDNTIDMLADPERWLADVLDDMGQHAEDFADPVTFRPLVIELDALGVHFIDAVLGAEMEFRDGQIWSAGLECDIADLDVPNLDDSPTLRHTTELARLAVQVSQGRILLTTPVLSCPINIGMNLFGADLLEALVTRPPVAARALEIIADTIIECTKVFMDVIPTETRRTFVACNRYAPAGFTEIDGCATHLLSGAHYAEFFAELDAKILRLSPHGGMIHVCGSHAQHIQTWAEMPEVCSLQLNDRATDDLELYRNGLRDDQVLYVAPTTEIPPERILELTTGRRVVLQAELTDDVLAYSKKH